MRKSHSSDEARIQTYIGPTFKIKLLTLYPIAFQKSNRKIEAGQKLNEYRVLYMCYQQGTIWLWSYMEKNVQLVTQFTVPR